MKVLIIQENGRHNANRKYRECFSLQRAFISNGWETTVWGLNQSEWPREPNYEEYDLIFYLEQYDLSGWSPDLSKTKKPYKIMWAVDAHSRGTLPYDYYYAQNKFELMLHSTYDFVDNEKRIWFPNAFDNTLLKPKEVPKIVDVGFCGNEANRSDYINLLNNQEFSFKADIFVIGDSMVNALNSYRISFNKNVMNDLNYRNFETIGCGTLLITNYNYQYHMLGFNHGVNCLLYNSKEELINLIKEYLHKSEQLKIISDKGLKFSKKHTYEQRVRHLLRYLSNKL
jgi:hypothetical protein